MTDIDPDTGEPIPRCPKCGGLMDRVTWFAGTDGRCGHRGGPDGETRCPGLRPNGTAVSGGVEHLHCDCSTCGYGAWMYPLDHKRVEHACGPECMYFASDVPHTVIPTTHDDALGKPDPIDPVDVDAAFAGVAEHWRRRRRGRRRWW